MRNIEKEYMTALQIAMDICQILLESGADVSKVEETAQRLCKAMDIKDESIIVLPAFISLTYLDEKKQKHTASRRCQETSTNLSKIEGACWLVDNIERNQISIDKICQQINRLQLSTKENSWKRLFAYWGVACIFTLISMGADIKAFVLQMQNICIGQQNVTLSLDDLIAHIILSILCSTIVYGIDQLLANAKVSDIFGKMISTAGIVTTLWMGNLFVSTLADMGIARLVICPMYILMGNIMLVVPGIKFTNGFKDLFSGDTASAIIHVTEALFSTIGIAIGVILLQEFLSVELSVISPTFKSEDAGVAYQCISILLAGLGTMFFSFYFRIDSSHKWLSFFAGAMTWGVYIGVLILVSSENQSTTAGNGLDAYWGCFLPNFCAAAFATIISELISNQKRTPTVIFLFPAIVALIPGGLLYRAMYGILSATLGNGRNYLFEALYTAGGISGGVFIVAAFRRIVLSLVESIDAKTAEEKVKSEISNRVLQDMETADGYYNTARRYTTKDAGCAYAFHQAAAAAYDSAISNVEKCDWNIRHEVYKKAGINKFWIYKCMIKTDENKELRQQCLLNAKTYYCKAQDALDTMVGAGIDSIGIAQRKAVLWNWLAVMEINEARYSSCLESKQHLDSAEAFLREALLRYPQYARIYVNLAEIAFCRIALILGIQYEHPISNVLSNPQSQEFLRNNKDKIERYFEIIEDNLELAKMRQSTIDNIYYKFAQLYTYRLCYRKCLKEDENSAEMKELQAQAESWLRLAALRDCQSTGYLFVYREYLELNNIRKACEVNEVIRQIEPLTANRWENALKSNGTIPIVTIEPHVPAAPAETAG